MCHATASPAGSTGLCWERMKLHTRSGDLWALVKPITCTTGKHSSVSFISKYWTRVHGLHEAPLSKHRGTVSAVEPLSLTLPHRDTDRCRHLESVHAHKCTGVYWGDHLSAHQVLTSSQLPQPEREHRQHQHSASLVLMGTSQLPTSPCSDLTGQHTREAVTAVREAAGARWEAAGARRGKAGLPTHFWITL